ncbi:DEAD/DEAH box helicase [Alicyclobacillus sp. SO9]|uniref:DEAD/DEAH box helicase n=1 Tax=Alicyclobacillus sp. SO9 TaxID=2665646 RepID=UPI0018E8FD8D|nr:SNF2-related protein [Alicyclobacillus sp. SO9]QQE76986.1 DEAD/DEAH box helicase [Alicyclobacillus sp. SO9]
MEPQETRLDSPVPEIVWQDNHLISALTAYKENDYLGNTSSDLWSLFQLAVSARKAQLASHFDELLTLDHIDGFKPMRHQIETAQKVLQQLHGRAILADEVGLGKTIEAGLILKEYMLRQMVKKALILVPASLVLQWTRELSQKFNIRCFAQRNEWSWSEHDIIIASLDTAKREPHREIVLQQSWDLVIIDEAHKLKNTKTKNWQMVNQIPNKFMLLLTATPIQNNLKELHTLVTLLKPGHLGNPVAFQKEHLQSSRVPKDAALLKEQVGHVMIRNRRMDGETNLPPREVQSIPIRLGADERELYDAVQVFLKEEYEERQQTRASVLPLITLQREICSSPYAAMITLQKMLKRAKSEQRIEALQRLMAMAEKVGSYTKVNRVLELLQQIDDKCIVFTEYRATQDFLLYLLRKNGISAVPFRGGFGRGKKDWMKDLFARKMQVLVATESGGEGINLQFCHHMINFDLPWNPMRLEQRIGRIHRLGQQENVHIYNLSTEDTIEEHIVHLLQEKIKMFELVIGDLDFIVGDIEIGDKFDKQVLDWVMTSNSKADLQEKLDTYGNQLLTQLDRSNKEANS